MTNPPNSYLTICQNLAVARKACHIVLQELDTPCAIRDTTRATYDAICTACDAAYTALDDAYDAACDARTAYDAAFDGQKLRDNEPQD